MKIAIIGTRGIPNNYGGFEQFAEYLSTMMVARGYEVTVYNPHFHPFKGDKFKGVNIIRKWSPEDKMGASANFVYDYLSLKDALGRGFDIIYEAGYATNVVSHLLLRTKHTRIVTNMDGLEWKRSKWGPVTRRLTKYFEYLAVKTSHYLIADNVGIQKYIKQRYGKDSYFLAYGANLVQNFSVELLQKYGAEPLKYYLIIARLEPENNIEQIIDGYLMSGETVPILVVGNKKTKFYYKLAEKTQHNANVKFLDGIYDQPALDVLRKYAIAYFHGHSVGGTNPSLLEAMSSQAFIVAHDNDFNRGVLCENALFFKNANDIKTYIGNIHNLRKEHADYFIQNNLRSISETYSWEKILDQHIDFFNAICNNKE